MPEVRVRVEREVVEKPAYHVPLMSEIAAIPANGLRAASLFSGCGGSSLGYKMAGFRVLWANEFVEEARKTYAANHAGTILDARDVRVVEPGDVLDACGLRPGELDLLDGSPPCASFSTSGKRQAGWGAVKAYSDTKQRTDDLFFEFARLLRGIRPRSFVAENVAGLVQGAAKGYFKMILGELRSCGYCVEARVLDAQWLGVPQTRRRLIFVGVRDDQAVGPAFPKPLPYRYSIRDACPWIDDPKSTVQVGDPKWKLQPGSTWPRGTERPITAPAPAPAITARLVAGHMVLKTPPADHARDLENVKIDRFAIGREWRRLKPGQSSNRYFNLIRCRADAPASAITQTAGGLGAAGVTHPYEERKFTIAEVRRLCSFPDDFVLTGTYEQQWERMGRAVPPLMMARIAEVVRDRILAMREGGAS